MVVYKDIYIISGLGISPTKIYKQSNVITMTENDTARLLISFLPQFADYVKSIDIEYFVDQNTTEVESYELTYDDILGYYSFILNRKFTLYDKIKIQFRARFILSEQSVVDPTILLLVFSNSLKTKDFDYINSNPNPDQISILQGMVDEHANLVGSINVQGHYKVDGTTVIANHEGILTFIGASGYSGWSGYSGYSGMSGWSGMSGPSGISGPSGASGYSGWSGWSGQGWSGWSGEPGWSGISGYSGWSGWSGISGYSGWSGWSGESGWSGISGYSGWSGWSGQGWSGWSGESGWSGISGYSGWSGWSGQGWSGWSGESGWSGISGYSGWSGESGWSGISGYSGWSGWSGQGWSGWSGESGWSGISGYSGWSGISGYSGWSGISGYSGWSGISGISGYSGYSGISGYSGPKGDAGEIGASGWSGYSGWSGSGGTSDNSRIELESLFKIAYDEAYHEFTYVNGDLSAIDVWVDSGKTTKLFSKSIIYDSGNISTITITDEVNSKILTKTFSYDIDGNIETITKVVV